MKLWVLCNPRSGSSFLCDLLNNTNLFPAYDHPNLVSRRGPIERGLAFNEWLRLYENKDELFSNPPSGLKVLFHQYSELFEPDTRNASYITDRIPDVKFIRLHRENIYEHAASVYFARVTDKWHIYDEKSLMEYLSTDIPIDYKLLMESYDEVTEYQSTWRDFGAPQTTYESLISNPTLVLGNILRYCGLPATTAGKAVEKTLESKRLFRMTRPELGRIVQILRSLKRRKLWA